MSINNDSDSSYSFNKQDESNLCDFSDVGCKDK